MGMRGACKMARAHNGVHWRAGASKGRGMAFGEEDGVVGCDPDAPRSIYLRIYSGNVAARRHGHQRAAAKGWNGDPRIVVGSVGGIHRRLMRGDGDDGLIGMKNAHAILALFAMGGHRRSGIGNGWLVGAAED